MKMLYVNLTVNANETQQDNKRKSYSFYCKPNGFWYTDFLPTPLEPAILSGCMGLAKVAVVSSNLIARSIQITREPA